MVIKIRLCLHYPLLSIAAASRPITVSGVPMQGPRQGRTQGSGGSRAAEDPEQGRPRAAEEPEQGKIQGREGPRAGRTQGNIEMLKAAMKNHNTSSSAMYMQNGKKYTTQFVL